jgi:hypothetical protein
MSSEVDSAGGSGATADAAVAAAESAKEAGFQGSIDAANARKDGAKIGAAKVGSTEAAKGI